MFEGRLAGIAAALSLLTIRPWRTWFIGLVWHVIEIAVIVAVIYLIVRFLIRRAIDR